MSGCPDLKLEDGWFKRIIGKNDQMKTNLDKNIHIKNKETAEVGCKNSKNSWMVVCMEDNVWKVVSNQEPIRCSKGCQTFEDILLLLADKNN